MNTEPPAFIKLLANDLRWSLLKALANSDHRVNELVDATGQPMNLVSYHLRRLRSDELVQTRRSDHDGRDVYYTINLDRLRQLYQEAGSQLHPMLGSMSPPINPAKTVRVLFICTENSARSQMAEALLREAGHGLAEVYSAGSVPAEVHPLAVETMARKGIDIRGQRAKHFDQFLMQPFDYVITVCDHAREVCPTFPGANFTMHWSIANPAAVIDEAERRAAFIETADRLETRVGHLLTLIRRHHTHES